MAEAQNTNEARDMRPTRLRDALRRARIEAADRTGVVVELRDAEVARLEILNEALDPLFNEVPEQVDLFDGRIQLEGASIQATAASAGGRATGALTLATSTTPGVPTPIPSSVWSCVPPAPPTSSSTSR